jgi:hypothetical protein
MHRTIVSLVDDLDGTEADETVTFGIDGDLFEIDLSEANAAALRWTLDAWVAKARRAGDEPVTHTGPTRLTTVLPAVGESRNALIRAWAAETGHHAPARGRIPQSVVNAYNASHP